MAINSIKGLTVEIGGDTTKLDKALANVEKNGRSLSTELGQINKLLKLDPGNTELLAQKQKVLANAISNTKEKLATLKEAEKQVQEQFARGEVSEEQVRSLQREIIATTNKLENYEKAAKEAGDASEKSSEKFEKLGDTLKKIGAVAASVVAAVGAAALKLGKEVVEAYGNYEQLVGGVETLFGAGGQSLAEYAKSVGKTTQAVKTEYDNLIKAQENVITNANNAYKTAGMSANEYMETVTSFSASLISSLDGDTVKAAKAADQAIIDMSDNANKMGTDIGSIQNAYQGFAKQNYTMLDNLKLGYGGTKEEMERLLADAEKLSGQKYDISNLNDVYEAIHVVQTELGITGTTAKEAEKTIQGSISALKASFGNLLAGLGDADADLQQLTRNVIDSFNNVVKNITPVVKNIIKALPTAINGLIAALGDLLPTMLSTVTDLFSQVLSTLISLLPQLIPAAVSAVLTIADTLIQNVPLLIDAIVQIVTQLLPAIGEAIPSIVESVIKVVPQIVDSLLSNTNTLLNAAIKFLLAIVDAVPVLIQMLVPEIPNIVSSVVSALIEAIPTLLAGAIQLFMAIVQAIPQILPELAKVLPEIIAGIVKGIIDGIPRLVEAAKQAGQALLDRIKSFFGIHSPSTVMAEVGTNLVAGIVNGIKNLPEKVATFFQRVLTDVTTWASNLAAKGRSAATSLLNAVVNGIESLPSKITTVGKNLVQGLWNGISGSYTWIKNKIEGWVDDVLSFLKKQFGINSPSKETAWIGEMLDEGLAKGIDDAAQNPLDSMDSLSSDLLDSAGDLNGVTLDRQLNATFSGSATESSKLDMLVALVAEYMPKLIDASKKSILLDGKTLVGETIDQFDQELSYRYGLKARGV